MTAQRISVRSLMRETLAAIGSVYALLLVINFVELLIVAVLNRMLGSGDIALNIIYWFLAFPLLCGTLAFYLYRNLTGNEVTVGEAFKQANRRLLQLMLANIPNLISVLPVFMLESFNSGGGRWPEFILGNNLGDPVSILLALGLVLLIFLWSYVGFRFTFSCYGTVIDNSSALHSVSSSWKITKGRFWLICRSIFLLFFVGTVPKVLGAILIYLIQQLAIAELWGSLGLVAQITILLLICLANALIDVYVVLLYVRLRDSAAATQ